MKTEKIIAVKVVRGICFRIEREREREKERSFQIFGFEVREKERWQSL